MSEPTDKLLTMREAADYLDVTYDWLQRQVSAGRVPHTKLGRLIRFAPAHIEHIVNYGVTTAPAPPRRAVGKGRRSTL